MLEDKDGYFSVTDAGKKEFAFHSTTSRSNSVMVAIGIVLIAFTLFLEWKIVPVESVAIFGVVLIFLGALFSMVSVGICPNLPISDRALLKGLKRH